MASDYNPREQQNMYAETLWYLWERGWFCISLGDVTHGLHSINVILWNTESLISINVAPLIVVIYLEIKMGVVRWKIWEKGPNSLELWLNESCLDYH